MAPAAKGLSLFGVGSKKSTNDVNGDMIVRKDITMEVAPPVSGKEANKVSTSAEPKKDGKSVATSIVPVVIPKLDNTKQDGRKSDAGAAEKLGRSMTDVTANEEAQKPAQSGDKAALISSESPATVVPCAPPAPPALPSATAATSPKPAVTSLGQPAPVALPFAAEAAAVAAAKAANTTSSSRSSDAGTKLAETAAPAPASKVTPSPAPIAPPMPALSPAITAPITPAPTPAAAAATVPVTIPTPVLVNPPKIRTSAAPVAAKTATAAADPQAAAGKMRAEDARAAWQTRPRVPVRLLDSYVNFMVVGESGLGKTTFIRNLVSSYNTTGKPHDGSSTSLASFQSSPDSLKTVLDPMEVVEAGRRVHVTVQDMPGWSDDINLVYYLRLLVNFILQKRAKDYEALAGGRALSKEAMCGQLQSSITACLYFLTPHRLKRVDHIMISALSQLVTVIPVIAKADTMTDSELAQYRKEIRSRLSNPAKHLPIKTLVPLEFNEFSFDDSVMEALGLSAEAWPLAIITSNKQEPISDRTLLSQLGLSQTEVAQPVREYKWGAAYALNREHSDLIILKRLLLGDRVDSLYCMLDRSYEKYVAFCDQYEEADKQLPLVVQDELSAAAYLEYDDYTNAKSALDAAQQAMSTLMAENKALVERLQALERSSGGGARRF